MKFIKFILLIVLLLNTIGVSACADDSLQNNANVSSETTLETSQNQNKGSQDESVQGKENKIENKDAKQKNSVNSGTNATQKPKNTSSEKAAEKDNASISVQIEVDASAAGRGIMVSKKVQVKKGSTVYDALCKAVKPQGRPSYISGINGLNEKEHGPLSGWVYTVNGVQVMKAANACKLKEGDIVVWTYVNVEK